METGSKATCLHPPHKKMSGTVASIPSMFSAAPHRGPLVLSCDTAPPFVLPRSFFALTNEI